MSQQEKSAEDELKIRKLSDTISHMEKVVVKGLEETLQSTHSNYKKKLKALEDKLAQAEAVVARMRKNNEALEIQLMKCKHTLQEVITACKEDQDTLASVEATLSRFEEHFEL